jgi:hypothetical protein
MEMAARITVSMRVACIMKTGMRDGRFSMGRLGEEAELPVEAIIIQTKVNTHMGVSAKNLSNAGTVSNRLIIVVHPCVEHLWSGWIHCRGNSAQSASAGTSGSSCILLVRTSHCCTSGFWKLVKAGRLS